jgi:hypothetical protein
VPPHHLRQRQAGVQVLFDVLDDGAELPRRQRAVRPAGRRAGGGGVADQVDGEQVGQRLGGQPVPGGAGRQLVVDRQQRGPQRREVQAVQRRERRARGVPVERLGGDPLHQPRLQEDVERVRVAAPAPPGRAAGRHQQDRAGRGRGDPADPFGTRLELLRGVEEQQQFVVRQGGLERLVGRLIPVAQRLQARPAEPGARRERLAGQKVDQVDRADRAAGPRLVLSHPLSP